MWAAKQVCVYCPQEGKCGHSLLHLAVKHADTELFTYLLQVQSVAVNLVTYSRLTALDIADMLSRHDMVRQLTAVAGQHSADYMQDSGSESDDVSLANVSRCENVTVIQHLLCNKHADCFRIHLADRFHKPGLQSPVHICERNCSNFFLFQ